MGNCIKAIDQWLWIGNKSMLNYDHCKPAPWASHKCLLVLRITIAIILLIQSLATMVISEWDTLAYFSFWQLYMSTVLFALLAYAQVTKQIKLNDFKLDIDLEDPDQEEQDQKIGTSIQVTALNSSGILDAEQDDNDLLEPAQTSEDSDKKESLWKWILLLYISSFSFSILDTIVFWTLDLWDNTHEEMIEDRQEIVIMFITHTIPIVCLLIEYPFNMVPINLRLMPFDCLIMLVYIFVSLMYNFISKKPVYGPSDWELYPLQATLINLSGFVIEICVCLSLWYVTEKIKLPKYRIRHEILAESLVQGL